MMSKFPYQYHLIHYSFGKKTDKNPGSVNTELVTWPMRSKYPPWISCWQTNQSSRFRIWHSNWSTSIKFVWLKPFTFLTRILSEFLMNSIMYHQKDCKKVGEDPIFKFLIPFFSSSWIDIWNKEMMKISSLCRNFDVMTTRIQNVW